MNSRDTGDQHPMYDRQLLLFGAKRDAVLELWEVERYGTDSYGDADYVSVYGIRPPPGMPRASGFSGVPPSNARAIG